METGLVNHTTGTSSQMASLTTARGVSQRLGSADRRAEYLLVIYPHGEVQEKLQAEQHQFSTDYGLQAMVRNRPHITVAAFQAAEPMEDTLIRWMQRICGRFPGFDLTLNNFSGIPPHTIYLRVQDPEPFRELTRQLRTIDDYVRSNGCPPVNLITRPYVAIAGGLTEQVYNKAMADYSRKDFHGCFPVDQLVLLKREHAFDACKTVNIFKLLPATDAPILSQV